MVETALVLSTFFVLVLGMIEDRALTKDLALDKPIPTLHAVSHDPTLTSMVRLRDGTKMTAIQVQWAYLEQARAYVESQGGPDEETSEVLDRWESVLTRLEPSKKAGMSLMKKLKIYDDEDVEDFNSKDLKELHEEQIREGMDGISPRYIINRLSSALVREGITCINPRAPALLVALGSRSGFSVRSTPTRSVAPTPDRFPSRTSAAAMRSARFASEVRDRNIAAIRSSSLFETTREPGKLRSPSIKSRILSSDGCLATTTAPGIRESVVFFETEVVRVEFAPIPAPENEIAARAATVVIPIEKRFSVFLTTST